MFRFSIVEHGSHFRPKILSHLAHSRSNCWLLRQRNGSQRGVLSHIKSSMVNVGKIFTLDTGLVSPGLSDITSGLLIAMTSGLRLRLFRFFLTSSSELQDDSLEDLRRRDFRCFLCFDLDLFLLLLRSSRLQLLLRLLSFFLSLLISSSSSSSKGLE